MNIRSVTILLSFLGISTMATASQFRRDQIYNDAVGRFGAAIPETDQVRDCILNESSEGIYVSCESQGFEDYVSCPFSDETIAWVSRYTGEELYYRRRSAGMFEYTGDQWIDAIERQTDGDPCGLKNVRR